MEYRKLISFGKNSFVVSLPKNWVRAQKLKKGDLIYIEEHGPKLILSQKEHEASGAEKDITINIDGKNSSQIQREVKTAYILNYRTIIVKGKELRTRVELVQRIFQNLIALEVMEQTEDSILAKDFLNMDKVSIEELFRKMDVVTRAMIKEAFASFTKEEYENVNVRDRDVNRLHYLLERVVYYNLDNPSLAMKNQKMNPIQILMWQNRGYFLEGAADEVRRVARYLYQLKLTQKQQDNICSFLNKTQEYYLRSIKILYAKNSKEAFILAGHKKILNIELDELIANLRKVENIDNFTARLRRLLSYIHQLVKSTYLMYDHQ